MLYKTRRSVVIDNKDGGIMKIFCGFPNGFDSKWNDGDN